MSLNANQLYFNAAAEKSSQFRGEYSAEKKKFSMVKN